MTSLAPKLTRAVSYRLKRTAAFTMDQFLHGSGSRAREPDADLAPQGMRLVRADSQSWWTASRNAKVRLGLFSQSPRLGWDPCSGSCPYGARRTGDGCCPSPEPDLHWASRRGSTIPLQRPVRGPSSIARSPRRPQQVSASATQGALEPHAVCGAATSVGTGTRKCSQNTQLSADCARPWQAEKQAKSRS